MSNDAILGKTPRMTHPSVLVFDQETRPDIVECLQRNGFQARCADRALSLTSLLEESRPESVLVVWKANSKGSTRALRELIKFTARFGVPAVALVDRAVDLQEAPHILSEVDDWLFSDQTESEMVLRLRSVIEKHSRRNRPLPRESSPVADSHFFALVAHDLRTPLNVISLSLRLISRVIPRDDPEIDEDFRFIEENFGQIERMLIQLSDYFKLFENQEALSSTEFDPRRAVEELLASRPDRASTRFGKVELIVRDSCPDVLDLDLVKARLAISYVLANATAAAGSTPIQLILSGGARRFQVEAILATPPPSSVKSSPLSSMTFLRLCGFAGERRGMDLAIAAKISEMFGGSARLDAEANLKTSIILDWPARLAAPKNA